MSGGYCKLFEDIVTSTIWQTPNNCRVLWVTMLALKDEMNICRATVPALAKICDMTLEECQKYLDDFQKPDPYSRSQEHEGKRIAPVDGGWLILNGQKYRDMLRGQERRDYIRQKVAEHRERVNKSKHGKQSKPIAEAEAQAEAVYNCYPKKVGRGVALKAIAKALGHCSIDRLLLATKAMGEAWKDEPDKQFCPNPATWFNQQRYLDDYETYKPHKNGNGQQGLSGIDKSILMKEKDLIVARLTMLRSQYDAHMTWSEKDKAEASKLKPRLAEINNQLGCLL